MARLRPRPGTSKIPASRHAAPDPGATTAGATADASLAGYRLIRRLAEGDRADVYLATVAREEPPGPGDRAGSPESLVVMRVYDRDADDAAIATEIAAMQHDGPGATAALLDVATLPDGRACLVVERIGGAALSGLIAPGGLLPGQAVTALAPIVVAVRELADRGLVHTRLAAADVVVDETGRPRLLGLGALRRLDDPAASGVRVDLLRSGHAALLRLIEDVAAATRDPWALDPVVRVARAAVEARPFVRVEEDLERALFATATPLPLPGMPSEVRARAVPARLAPVVPAGAVTDHVGPGADVEGADDARRAGHRWARLAEVAQLPGGLAGDLAASLDRDPRSAFVRRIAGWAQRRRGALVTGGLIGAAALVALLTALPPSVADVRAEPELATASPEGAPAGSAPPGGDEAVTASAAEDAATATIANRPVAGAVDDPVAAAAALLEIRTSCLAGGDAECLAAVDQPGSPMESRDLAAIRRGGATAEPAADLDAITLVADLGDAVVLSVPHLAAEREPASLLVMRSEAGWRLREWFD